MKTVSGSSSGGAPFAVRAEVADQNATLRNSEVDVLLGDFQPAAYLQPLPCA